jgi:hypothetical protein
MTHVSGGMPSAILMVENTASSDTPTYLASMTAQCFAKNNLNNK